MPIEIVTGEAARANVASLPANIMIYGNPGTLKTTDAILAFSNAGRCSAFVIPCEDGALKAILAAEDRGGAVPDHPKYTVKTWGAMQESIAWLGQHKERYNAVIIDGATPFSTYLYQAASEQFKGKNKFDIPVAVRTCLLNLREWIRQLGMHSIFIAHAAPPAVNDGVFYPGCFELAPKSMIRNYYGALDTVIRTDYIVPQPGQAPMRVYYTGGTTWPPQLSALSQPPDWRGWLTKNREGVDWAVVPADLRAFMRFRQPPYTGL